MPNKFNFYTPAKPMECEYLLYQLGFKIGGSYKHQDCSGFVNNGRSCIHCKSLKHGSFYELNKQNNFSNNCFYLNLGIIDTIDQESVDLAKIVYKLFNSSFKQSKYLLLLSVVYGDALFQFNNVIKNTKPVYYKSKGGFLTTILVSPFRFSWKKYQEQYEYLVHVQSIIGIKKSKILRGDTSLGLNGCFFSFSSS